MRRCWKTRSESVIKDVLNELNSTCYNCILCSEMNTFLKSSPRNVDNQIGSYASSKIIMKQEQLVQQMHCAHVHLHVSASLLRRDHRYHKFLHPVASQCPRVIGLSCAQLLNTFDGGISGRKTCSFTHWHLQAMTWCVLAWVSLEVK